MTLLELVRTIDGILALPATVIFLAAGIILTIKTNFIQLRALNRFFTLIQGGLKKGKGQGDTINPFHALFTAMSTTLGMGNIVGPTVAIIGGGPGALFWLIVYAFFGAVTKFVEVSFALSTRIKTDDNRILGGPSQYLALIHPYLSTWYGAVMLLLFACWSGVQANTLASIFYLENVPHWLTGATIAVIVLLVLHGGAHRVGLVASRLVPLMTILYISFALLILLKDPVALKNAFALIGNNIFTPAAAINGFIGATIFQAIKSGVYRSIYITEAGLGTSSIAHAMADTQKPTDQGILAMYSMAADAFLSLISGLLVLVTGIWMVDTGSMPMNTLMYQVFKIHSPTMGKLILIFCISLFVLTTVIGNSFNGSQSFASMLPHRYVKAYHLATALIIFLGAISHVPLVWAITDVLLTLVAVPHLFGITLLAFKKPEVLSQR